MEVIFCVELWVTNNHSVLRELSRPLIACAVHLPPRLPESCRREEPNLTRFLSFVTHKYQSATAITSLCCRYSKEPAVLCCAGSACFWLWLSKVIWHE